MSAAIIHLESSLNFWKPALREPKLSILLIWPTLSGSTVVVVKDDMPHLMNRPFWSDCQVPCPSLFDLIKHTDFLGMKYSLLLVFPNLSYSQPFHVPWENHLFSKSAFCYHLPTLKARLFYLKTVHFDELFLCDSFILGWSGVFWLLPNPEFFFLAVRGKKSTATLYNPLCRKQKYNRQEEIERRGETKLLLLTRMGYTLLTFGGASKILCKLHRPIRT